MNTFISFFFLLFSVCASVHANIDSPSGSNLLFSQECRLIDEDYLVFSVNFDLKDKKIFSFHATAFEDEKCQKPYLTYNQYFNISNFNETNLDLNTIATTYILHSEEVAEALNLMAFCNISNWKPKKETIVSGLICGDYKQLAANEAFFHKLKLDKNHLSLGQLSPELNGKSSEKRPQQFDSHAYYNRTP